MGRYARCLLDALRERTEPIELVETHDPRRCDVYHSPWIDGAMLRCPVPMVVTVHDVVELKRRGAYLRAGLRLKLRYLAVHRATRVIVPTHAVADDVINVLGIPRNRPLCTNGPTTRSVPCVSALACPIATCSGSAL